MNDINKTTKPIFKFLKSAFLQRSYRGLISVKIPYMHCNLTLFPTSLPKESRAKSAIAKKWFFSSRVYEYEFPVVSSRTTFKERACTPMHVLQSEGRQYPDSTAHAIPNSMRIQKFPLWKADWQIRVPGSPVGLFTGYVWTEGEPANKKIIRISVEMNYKDTYLHCHLNQIGFDEASLLKPLSA